MSKNLIDYINDHLAGSVAAVELLEDWREAPSDEALRSFLAQLHKEVLADQAVLKDLLEALDARESPLKKGAAWLSEKVLSLRLQGSDSQGNLLGLLETLEMLALGIQGKRLLWRALAPVAASSPVLERVDFPALERRATEQFDQVEAWRLVVARSALGPAASA